MQEKVYDVVVIGAGPCGCTAALYAGRAGLSVLVLEALAPGGQMATTDRVENYPGFPEGIGGFELADQMCAGAKRFGAVFQYAQAQSLELEGDVKKIHTSAGVVLGKSVILAMGAAPRELGLESETALRGRGVSYCATCDGMFYKDKEVAIIGGGDTAAADAVYLSRICRKVTLIHRRDTLRASRAYTQPLHACENLDFLWDTVPTAILGENAVEGLELKHVKTGEISRLDCQGVFVAIGNVPNSGLVRGLLELDAGGYIVADDSGKTAIPGVFAAGDVRKKTLRQVVTAVSDGAQASLSAEEYLSSLLAEKKEG